jgi:general stress protein YciG
MPKGRFPTAFKPLISINPPVGVGTPRAIDRLFLVYVRLSPEGQVQAGASFMSEERKSPSIGSPRGFATMDHDKQREIARKGGANVPHDKRSFARNRALASEAGRKGGRSVAPHTRSFSQNRALAAEAGRKGGRASQRRRSHANMAGDGALEP